MLAGRILAVVVGSSVMLAGCGTGARHRTATAPSSSSSTTSPITSGTSSAPGSPTAPGGHLSVAPAAGHPNSTLRFTFVAPTAGARHGQISIAYALNVAGVQSTGCVAQHAIAVPVPHAGQPVTVPVGPAQLGGRWCPGSYTARVDELARPVCVPTHACPQFIRVMAVFGPLRFRIAA